MKLSIVQMAAMGSLAFTLNLSATTHYVDANGTNPVSPYTSWETAATNIQDAVNAANSVDVVLVTNGTYMYGVSDSSRVYVGFHKTVQSVNGPAVTIIRGYQIPGSTNGNGAVQCVYLNDGATLSGFTLTNGATQSSGSGGGVYCVSTNCLVTNCVITGNAAYSFGGGAYSGTLINCSLTGNIAMDRNSEGGGTCQSSLINCILTGNYAVYAGGGSAGGTLINCIVANNFGSGGIAGGTLINCTVVNNSGGGTYQGTLYNCIVYYNSPENSYQGGVFNNCCVIPLPVSGINNITNAPRFVNLPAGDLHLNAGSPCINAGDNSFVTSSTDLDGNPRIIGGTVDLGAYEFRSPVRYVNLINTTPVSPFTNWSTAAKTIQDAIDAANAGDVIVVSNGVYKTGGRVVHGSLTNRVVVDKAVTVQSLNGPIVTNVIAGRPFVMLGTVIQGNPVSGDSAVRCVYLTNGATLVGFVLTNGATRYSGDIFAEQSGGGAWCESSSAVVWNCLITGNSANQFGGGISGGTLLNCMVASNHAGAGGGAVSNIAWNCTFIGNTAASGGGAVLSRLFNCTIISNNAVFGSIGAGGGGVASGSLSNCTLTANYCDNGAAGAQYSALDHCTLNQNHSDTACGGTYQCTNYSCTFLGNSGYSGGAMYGGISYNCLVTSNTAGYQGGGAFQGALFNCTVIGNSATNSVATGGGVYGSSMYNCIVYSNSAPSGSNWFISTTINYCCTLPKPFSGNNITNAPLFVDPANGDFRLACGSPGINAGNNSYATVTNDLEGKPRIVDGTVDMGACEFNLTADLVPRIHKNFSFDNFATSYPVPFAIQIGGCPDYFWWDFGDGTTATNQYSMLHAWTLPGTYNVVVTAYSASLGYGLSATTPVQVVSQPVYYVNASSATPVAPYTNWATAARYIQDGIRVGNTPGRLVLVTNGLYQGQVTTADGTQWKNVILTNFAVVQSVNGPGATIINNYNPYRVAYAGNNSILNGFTLTGGGAFSGSDPYRDLSGGGIWCEPFGMVSNCIVTGNSASYGGGGAYQGVYYDCVFSNNTVTANDAYSGGGGAYAGTFHHCYFVSNTVYGNNADFLSGGGAVCMSTLYDSCLASNQTLYFGRGGGALSCVLSNCQVAYNTADYHGGGAASSTLYHCMVRGNSTTTSGGGGGASCTFWSCVLMENRANSSGGGAGWSLVHNSLVVSNQAVNNGGGLYGGTNYNCTIVQNKAGTGGGFYGSDNPSMVYNGIIFGNIASGSSSNWAGIISARNSCSVPKLNPTSPSSGNITNDPVFVDAAFHLSANSPCRGTGSSLYTSGTDLDGEIWNSPPSMGADEVYDADFTGVLSVAIQSDWTNLLANRPFALAGQITGRAARLQWSFGDATVLTNANWFTSHLWTVPGDYSVVFTAFNTDNPGGVSANLLVHVLPLEPPLLQPGSFSLSSPSRFHFQFNGQSDAIYTVQMATNLVPPVVWQNLQTITSTGGVVQITDATATNVTRFYRVGVQ